MAMNESQKFIDVEKIFHDKNPKLAKLLPGFILNYIRRIIHEEELNIFIETNKNKKDFEWLSSVLETFQITVKATGQENIPLHGGFIMAINHPLGGFDCLALLQIVGHKRKDVKFLVNDILLQLKNMEGLFTGVNKHGKTAIENLAAIDKLYASEHGTLLFPAGLVSRKQHHIIKDLEWKKSFVTKAKKYNRMVIPVHVEGANTNRFYNLANWRKRFGIKANIEMFFLVDEMYRQKGKTITITIGEAIPCSTFNKSKSDYDWAQWVKERVYELGALKTT